MKSDDQILHEVSDYYSAKLNQFGVTPQGVDWNGSESQDLRFVQLSRILDTSSTYSVADLGCGYGALCEFLQARGDSFRYEGYDVSEAMIAAARQRISRSEVRWTVSSKPDRVSDFAIASGIFNVRLQHSQAAWEEYIFKTLDVLNESSARGFAFNCLTSYSDKEKMRPYLYYANPGHFFDHCKCKYSREVALLHDYGLYEFTILVRKF
jgi:SAM-dependent methyltransferase